MRLQYESSDRTEGLLLLLMIVQLPGTCVSARAETSVQPIATRTVLYGWTSRNNSLASERVVHKSQGIPVTTLKSAF